MINKLSFAGEQAQQTFEHTVTTIKKTYQKQIDLIDKKIEDAAKEMEFSIKISFKEIEGMDDTMAKHLKLYYITQGYNAAYLFNAQCIKIYWGLNWNEYSLSV